MKRRILTTSFCILILCGAVLAALSITGTRQQLTLTEIINARRDPHIEALLDDMTLEESRPNVHGMLLQRHSVP